MGIFDKLRHRKDPSIPEYTTSTIPELAHDHDETTNIPLSEDFVDNKNQHQVNQDQDPDFKDGSPLFKDNSKVGVRAVDPNADIEAEMQRNGFDVDGVPDVVVKGAEDIAEQIIE